MDTSTVTRIFRQLFAHETCSVLRFAPTSRPARQSRHYTTRPPSSAPPPTAAQRRRDTRNKPVTLGDLKDTTAWNKRSEFFQDDVTDEYLRFPAVTAEILRSRRTRPLRVKMLLRDFIDDSLYNPHYGYFPKEAVIFSPKEPFDFNGMRNGEEFTQQLTRQYTAFEDALDMEETARQLKEGGQPMMIDPDRGTQNDVRQVWHTPTELFQPYYAEAMARYMATNYKLSQYPYHDLLIYEMGAGNGTFMLNVLDYIRDVFPEVYERTQFKIIEISSSLASLQLQNLRKRAQEEGHLEKVEIINTSIFDWNTYVSTPCFFVALEVWDNFSHDCIHYDPRTGDAYQTWVIIDRNGDFYEHHETTLDPVAERFLRIRDEAAGADFDHPLKKFDLSRKIMSLLPGSSQTAGLSRPEYIPTRLMQFFDVLHNYFPAHRLLSSDFDGFKTEVPGINAPAVQTRFKRQMVGVTTPLVMQGHFDIMFPTDFKTMEAVYRAMTGKLTRVVSQEHFLKRWAHIEETQTRNGENPLLDWYKNASMMLTL